MNDYEARRQEKEHRYQELADKNQAAANQTQTKAREMADIIPFGQPILVGHHSEGRDRRYRARIENTFKKASDLKEKADYYQRKAESTASNHAISSDDPEAVTKLREKIASAEESGATMRAFNKCMRANDNAGMLALVGSQAMIDELKKPDFAGRCGFADYQMSNNSGNIGRMKKRLGQLERHSTDTTTEKEAGDIRIVDNVEDNRLQMFFPGKPSEEIRRLLKSRGFRWSPMSGAWQRHRSNGATWEADHIIEQINKGEVS